MGFALQGGLAVTQVLVNGHHWLVFHAGHQFTLTSQLASHLHLDVVRLFTRAGNRLYMPIDITS